MLQEAQSQLVEAKLDEIELLEEIAGICIGADSPDAINNNDPEEELRKCRQDLEAISGIVEKILDIKGVA